MDNQDRRIRDRAYLIWVEEGRPLGREEAHWQRAREEIEGEAHDEPPPTVTDNEEAELNGEVGSVNDEIEARIGTKRPRGAANSEVRPRRRTGS